MEKGRKGGMRNLSYEHIKYAKETALSKGIAFLMSNGRYLIKARSKTKTITIGIDHAQNAYYFKVKNVAASYKLQCFFIIPDSFEDFKLICEKLKVWD